VEPLPARHAPTLWGKTDAERWAALDDATLKLNEQLQKPAVMSGAQLALRRLDDVHRNPKAKCPFVPQREMVKKLWGTDADPLAHKSEWEAKLAGSANTISPNNDPPGSVGYCGGGASSLPLRAASCRPDVGCSASTGGNGIPAPPGRTEGSDSGRESSDFRGLAVETPAAIPVLCRHS